MMASLGSATFGALAAVLLPLAPSALAQGAVEGLRGHGGPVRAIIALADGKTIVSGGFDSAIIVWDGASGTARQVLRFHDSTINALLALDDSCFASAGEDARIAIWCGDATAPVRVLEGHKGPIAALALSPDRRMLASAAWDRTVRVWPLRNPNEAPRIAAEHSGPVNGAAFLPDGWGLVSGSYDGQIRITPLDGSAALQVQTPAPIHGLAVAPNGRIVTTSADGYVRVLDQKLDVQAETALPDGPLTAVAVSPDGLTIAAAGMRTPVTLIDMTRTEATRRILGPGLPIWSLAFSRDGTSLFSGGADRAVRRWETATGKPMGEAISPPGDTLAASSTERGAQVFRACAACHGVTASDVGRAGPNLHGVFGRRIATAPGYAYSDALKKMDIVWTAETISKLFEAGPAAYTPGTKMPEQRITDPEDRKALVEWLARVAKP